MTHHARPSYQPLPGRSGAFVPFEQELITIYDVILFVRAWRRMLLFGALAGAVIATTVFIVSHPGGYRTEVTVATELDRVAVHDLAKIKDAAVLIASSSLLQEKFGSGTLDELARLAASRDDGASKAKETFALLDMPVSPDSTGRSRPREVQRLGALLGDALQQGVNETKTSLFGLSIRIRPAGAYGWYIAVQVPKRGLGVSLIRAITVGLRQAIEGYNAWQVDALHAAAVERLAAQEGGLASIAGEIAEAVAKSTEDGTKLRIELHDLAQSITKAEQLEHGRSAGDPRSRQPMEALAWGTVRSGASGLMKGPGPTSKLRKKRFSCG